MDGYTSWIRSGSWPDSRQFFQFAFQRKLAHNGAMKRLSALLLVAVGATSALASPFAATLNTNMTRYRVNVANNAEVPLGTNPFMSDSLAMGATGTLYSADSLGVIWDVSGAPIPVGPTGKTQIGDLVAGNNGLWGFSNFNQELFFFDFGTSSVTYAQSINGVGGFTITGVAYQGSTGDVYLSGNIGLNTDTLFHVMNSSTSATAVGAMNNGDGVSYFSDIEFDASGTLYAMSWYHRWFYSVSTVNANTSFVSAGPHRDVTAMALPVPEPSAFVGIVVCFSFLLYRKRPSGR